MSRITWATMYRDPTRVTNTSLQQYLSYAQKTTLSKEAILGLCHVRQKVAHLKSRGVLRDCQTSTFESTK